MFKVVGLLALSTAVLSANSYEYSDNYDVINDEQNAYSYYGNDNYNYQTQDYEVEEGAADDDFEEYEDDYDFSEFDGQYLGEEGYDDNDIAYGWFARIGQLPYTVYLRITKADGKVGICSGSIVGRRTVLTAHHCLSGNPKSIRIEAGTLKGGKSAKTRQVRYMKRWIRPSQTSSTAGKDFGFIYTDKPFSYTKAVYRIKLCGSRSSKLCGDKVLKPGKKLYASGFGRQGYGTIGVLKYASMYQQSDSACKKAEHGISTHHICTKGGSGNTCGGDSGGPLVIRRSSSGRWDVQVGANSYSKTHCSNKNGNWDVFFEISYAKPFWDQRVHSYYKTGVTWV